MRKEIRFGQAIIVAGSLAFFQAVFPVFGWFFGTKISSIIVSYDHWIAFGLLTLIGVKMFIEGVKPEGLLKHLNPFNPKILIGLSIATSVDALVVGFSFGFLEIPILFPVVVIGGVTFIASMLGMLFGKNISAKRSHQSLMIGGLILIVIGIKILVEHLWF